MMPASVKMLLLDLVYGTAASTRIPWGYSLLLVNRKPPLEMSSQATTTSMPECRMHADFFIAIRLFLRRSAIGDAATVGFGSCPGELPGFFSTASRTISFQVSDELQLSQERVNSRVAPKISNSISERESVCTEWQLLHS